jgi:hypothetical protein
MFREQQPLIPILTARELPQLVAQKLLLEQLLAHQSGIAMRKDLKPVGANASKRSNLRNGLS